MKGLKKVNSELRHLHTGDYYTSDSLTEEQKNSNLGFFISLLLGSCISPGERPAEALQQGARGSTPFWHAEPRPHSPDLPPDQEPPPTYPEKTLQQKSQHLSELSPELHHIYTAPKNDQKAQVDGEE